MHQQPLTVRHGLRQTEDNAPYDGIPKHLWAPVRDWLGTYASSSDLINISLRLRLDITNSSIESVNAGRAFVDFVAAKYASDVAQSLILDTIDIVLSLLWARAKDMPDVSYDGGIPEPTYRWETAATRLAEALNYGGSAWCIDADRKGLDRRVAEPVRQAVESTFIQAERARRQSAAGHLASAWKATYGRHPNYSDAYAEAIRAVEAAAAPTIMPKDALATLGRICGELRAKPSLWSFALPPGDIGIVTTMAASLWEGQTNRHGGNHPTIPIQREAAECAVHMAATLVQWFVAGSITRAASR